MHPSPLDATHYSLEHVSYVKEYRLLYNLPGDLRVSLVQMDRETYLVHKILLYLGRPMY